MNRVKNSLAEGLGGLILILILGFPVWIPIIFIINDLLTTNNPLVQLITDGSADYKYVFSKLLQYTIWFIPALVIYFVWRGEAQEEVAKDQSASELIKVRYVCKKNNPLSSQVSWKPKAITGGNPTNNRAWKTIRPGVIALSSTYLYQVFTYPLISGGLIYSAVCFYESGLWLDILLNYGFLVSVIGIFLNLFFYISKHELVYNDNKKKLMLGADIVRPCDVNFIQILKKQRVHTSDGEIYAVYEGNLIYDKDKRFNFLNHGGLFDILSQVAKLNEFLKVNVVLDDETLDDIELHNKEAKIKGN